MAPIHIFCRKSTLPGAFLLIEFGIITHAEAVDGVDAVAKAQQFRPDIIILDFFMPGMTGVDAARVLGRVLPSVPILIVTLHVTAEMVKQAKAAGIEGAASIADTCQILNGVEALINKKTFFESKRDEPVAEWLL